MEQKMVPFQLSGKGYHLMLEALPAWVCSQCGEFYFDEAEVETIQSFIKTLDEQIIQFSPTSLPQSNVAYAG